MADKGFKVNMNAKRNWSMQEFARRFTVPYAEGQYEKIFGLNHVCACCGEPTDSNRVIYGKYLCRRCAFSRSSEEIKSA